MRLRFNPASPFARKVLVVAHEKGLADRIEIVATDPRSDPTLAEDNPLRLIPALVTDDGDAIFDSPVICDYLEALRPEPRLVPGDPEGRLRVLRLQALADGMCDAAVARRQEGLRPDGERSPAALERLALKVQGGLDWLESHVDQLDEEPDLGRLAVACALGYLDFRFGDEDWRSSRPKLAGWNERFGTRPSLRATAPR
jgi:glutathione S-transferase